VLNRSGFEDYRSQRAGRWSSIFKIRQFDQKTEQVEAGYLVLWAGKEGKSIDNRGFPSQMAVIVVIRNSDCQGLIVKKGSHRQEPDP